MESQILKNRYSIKKELGKGSFGVVHKVYDLKKKINLAVKMMSHTCSVSQYNNEVNALKILNKVKGIPRLYDFGKKGSYKYIIIDLLGKSVQEMFYCNKKKFSIQLVVNLAIQMVKRVASMHKRNLLHRDLKPHQFLVGKNDPHCLYLVDYGLSKPFCTDQGIHVKYSQKTRFAGTPYYASLNTHFGINQSRRDDLQSLCYVFSYLLNGTLPWISMNNRDSQIRVTQQKSRTTPRILFQNYPTQFLQIFEYVKTISFQQKPDYQFILRKLKQVRVKSKHSSKVVWNEKFLKFRRPTIKYHEDSVQRIERVQTIKGQDFKIEDLEYQEMRNTVELRYSQMQQTQEAQERPKFHWNNIQCYVSHFQFKYK